MPRFTIIVDAEPKTELESVERWFARWKNELIYVSPQFGCGCCIFGWDVEGPQEALEELPREVLASGDWSRSDKRK